MIICALVRQTAPRLLTRPGVGIHTAAQLLMTAGGNPERLHSDAAFAALCGASPVQASRGQTHRHRLSRGGDRDANNALWTIANNRLIHDPTTRAFAARRKTTGDSRNDTLRVLKRYIARETSPSSEPLSALKALSRRLLDIGASTPWPRPLAQRAGLNRSAIRALARPSTTLRLPSPFTSTGPINDA